VSTATGGEVSWEAVLDAVPGVLPLADGASLLEKSEDVCCLLIAWLVPLAAVWTLALIQIRLIGPRPRFRALARQPGMVAAVSVGLATTLMGLPLVVGGLVFGLKSYHQSFPPVAYFALELSHLFIAMAVLVSWMTLILGGRWRVERSWIDRLGRVAGTSWVFVGLVALVLWVVENGKGPVPLTRYAPLPAAPGGAAAGSTTSPPSTPLTWPPASPTSKDLSQ
jgi:hypothetical protein